MGKERRSGRRLSAEAERGLTAKVIRRAPDRHLCASQIAPGRHKVYLNAIHGDTADRSLGGAVTSRMNEIQEASLHLLCWVRTISQTGAAGVE